MRNRAGIETETRILAATRRLLADHGLEGTTVRAICEGAGVRSGSFYHLFQSKDQAVLSVVREAITAVDPDPTGAGTDRLTDLVEAYIAFVEQRPTLARVYVVVAISGSLTEPSIARRVLRHHRERIDRFTAALARDRPDLAETEVAARAEALMAALNGYTFYRLLDPGFDFAHHARRLLLMEPA